ncbi:MAG: hypothetical protein WKG00_03615 [Polyangiaceae bacterium]
MADKPPLPHFPGGPDPGQPVPRTAVHGLDVAAYARVAAALAERPTGRARVLAEHQLDEARWMQIEQTWLLRVATASLQHDLALGEELDRAYTAAQAALGESEPTRTLEQYAALTARIERGEATGMVISAAGLSLADWTRLARAWTTRLARDPALSATFRAMVNAAPA